MGRGIKWPVRRINEDYEGWGMGKTVYPGQIIAVRGSSELKHRGPDQKRFSVCLEKS